MPEEVELPLDPVELEFSQTKMPKADAQQFQLPGRPVPIPARDVVAQFRQKMGRYTALEAGILHDQGVQVRPWTYVSMPLREFWRRFVVLGGYRDHVYGLLFGQHNAWA